MMNNDKWPIFVAMCTSILIVGCGSDAETPTTPIAKGALMKAGDNQRFLDYYAQALTNTSQQIRTMAATPAATTGGGGASVDFAQSSTNLIEAGVDESDVMKQNATHLYSWDDSTSEHQAEIHTLKLNVFAKPNAEKVAGVEIQGVYPEGIFLTGQYLAALSTKSYPQWLSYSGEVPLSAQGLSLWRWGALQNGKAQLDVMTVANPAKPQISKHYEWDGDIVASRRIANRLYVVTQSSIAMPPMTTQQTSTQTDVTDIAERMPVDALGQRIKPKDCYIAQTLDKQNINASIVLITQIDLTAEQSPQTTCVAASTQQVYVSPKSLYLLSGQGWERQKTVFHKFDLGDTGVQYRASGEVAGSILWNNPAFSMSEHKDYFRVVTSEFVRDAATGLSDFNSRLYILKESINEQGVFEQVAQLPNTARPARIGKPREQIMGMRFLGDNAYIVTFERKDPLYKVDLTDPTQPRLAGELELAGYSAYLQQLTPRYVMGVGFSVDEKTQRQNGIQVSVFDTHLDTPSLVSQDVYSAVANTSWFDLPLARDSHAIMTLSNGTTTRMILPLTHSTYTNTSSVTITKGLQYEIDETTGVLKRVAEQDVNTQSGWWGWQRSMLDGDLIYWNKPQGAMSVGKWGQ
ncbi:MAG: beta-propeller domain-containing protein [Agitococcus sp.]|nr:beta-propeller domain-containing protein [Agitococcus sp.]